MAGESGSNSTMLSRRFSMKPGQRRSSSEGANTIVCSHKWKPAPATCREERRWWERREERIGEGWTGWSMSGRVLLSSSSSSAPPLLASSLAALPPPPCRPDV
eukprot:693291-Hanusia_phi.AAC.3